MRKDIFIGMDSFIIFIDMDCTTNKSYGMASERRR